MLKVENLGQAFGAIGDWLREVEEGTEAVALNLGSEAFVHAVRESPQYSGDYAANWKLSLNTPDTSFIDGVFPDKKFRSPAPFIHGDRPAMDVAFVNGSGKLHSFKLGDTIWLANSARHTNKKGMTDYYAWKIENNAIKFRNGNNYPATIQNTIDMLMMEYRTISNGVFYKWLREKK